jgi:hypothetical protein
MVITNYSKNQIGLILGGSATNIPEYFLIGSGSGTASITDTTLVYPVDRQEITTTTYPESQKVAYQGDWNAIQMSGIQLRQFGLLTSGAGLTGSMWSKESLAALTFDGTNALRITETWEVY